MVDRGLIGEKVADLVNGFLHLGKIFTVGKMNGGIGKNLLIDELLHSRHLITDASDVKGGEAESIGCIVINTGLFMK